jgi:hypothetical protein
MELGSVVRLNSNPVPTRGTTGTILVCSGAASSSSIWRRPWLSECTLLVDLGRSAAVSACTRARLKLCSTSSSTCFRGQRRARGTVPVTALGTNTGHPSIERSHGQGGEAEKDRDDSVTPLKHQLLLQQQEQNADADATSILGTNVEDQLQASSSNSPSKPRRIALFVEPSPFACVSPLFFSLPSSINSS